MDIEELLSNRGDLHSSLSEVEVADTLERAIAVGAQPPLTYVGVGMTGIVYCNDQTAYKVFHHLKPFAIRMLADEYEWLLTANTVPELRSSVAQVHAVDFERGVLIRECVDGRPGGWGDELRELHKRIEELMLLQGWTSPEYKEDSYIIRGVQYYGEHGEPVLVDASMAHRVGPRLLEYVEDVIAGERPWGQQRPRDLGYHLRGEVHQGTLTQAQVDAVLEILDELQKDWTE
jgi:hypothetical protein